MKRIVPLIAAILLVSSCSSFLNHYGDRKVAAIGRDVLYESDVVKLLPENVSSEDSVKMVRRYVDTWAMSKLMLLKAGKELSKSDRNVDAQIEDYRRNLLGFRYEKAYIEANLDTVVTDAEIGKYYQDHPANYVFPYSIVKARVARVSPKSPYYEMILGDFDAVEKDDVSRLEKICYDSAERYTDFGGKWIPVSTLAKEIDEDLLACESEIAHKSLFEKKDETTSYLVFVTEYVAPDELSPVEYNWDNIKETIINKRKQDLLAKMEQELLEDALVNKTLKIYEYDE